MVALGSVERPFAKTVGTIQMAAGVPRLEDPFSHIGVGPRSIEQHEVDYLSGNLTSTMVCQQDYATKCTRTWVRDRIDSHTRVTLLLQEVCTASSSSATATAISSIIGRSFGQRSQESLSDIAAIFGPSSGSSLQPDVSCNDAKDGSEVLWLRVRPASCGNVDLRRPPSNG